MEIKFPKKRADGSFCVEIELRVHTDDANGLAARITLWLEEWTQENRYWNWFEERLDFLNEFAGPPTCAKGSPKSLVVRVEGTPQFTKWWRDWIGIRLLKELRSQFPEITAVEGVVNCPE